MSDQEENCPPLKRAKKKQEKPKVTSEWTDDEIFKLISCVENVPILWDAQDAQYRNKVKRQSAWRDMSELNFGSKFADNELLAKWTNMRIQFRSYANSKKGKSGQGSHFEVTWKFYEAMEFVENVEQNQTATTISNLV